MQEQQLQVSWEQTRWMTCTLLNPQLKRPLTPRKLLPFHWDKALKLDKEKLKQTRAVIEKWDSVPFNKKWEKA